MPSRRIFLAASLALLLEPAAALAKKHAPVPPVPVRTRVLGPHTLARQEWPPSLAPDFVAVVDKGHALLADQSGRLAIVDLTKEQGALVTGELSALGRKLIDLQVLQHRVFAIVATESSSGELQHFLYQINVGPLDQPAISVKIPLPYLAEPGCIAVSKELVAVGGTAAGGQNQIFVFELNSKKGLEEGEHSLATISVSEPISAISFDEKNLLVAQAQPSITTLDVFSMSNHRAPHKTGTLRLKGNYPKLSATRELVVLAGTGEDRKSEVIIIGLKPTLQAVSKHIMPLSEILDIATQQGGLLVLGSQGGRLAVIPVTIGKHLIAATGYAVMLPPGARGASSKARITVHEKEAYIASDAGSVQVLSIGQSSWQYLYSHTIPRLPVASVALSDTWAVLAGADIKVYDISQPEHPVLVGDAQPGSVVRSVAIVGSLLLILTQDSLSLRRLDKPSSVVSSIKVEGSKLAYDQSGKAYLIAQKDKGTQVTPVKVTTTLTAEEPMMLKESYMYAAAASGKLLLSQLSSLALYDMESRQQTGSRAFPNLAIRDLEMAGEVALVAAVDADMKGYLLTVNVSQSDLGTLGSVDLAQDAAAVAVNGNRALVAGKNPQGKDVASIIDLANPVAPKVVTTFPVLDSASAVAVKDRIGLIGGRGLQLVTL